MWVWLSAEHWALVNLNQETESSSRLLTRDQLPTMRPGGAETAEEEEGWKQKVHFPLEPSTKKDHKHDFS